MPHFEPRLTRGEYWILESVVEHGTPACWYPSANLTRLLNKREGHGLDRPALMATLERLIGQGWIGVRDLRRDDDPGEVYAGTLDRAGIEAALDERGEDQFTHLGLTAEGGRVWEEFARPNWNAFIDHYTRGFGNSRRKEVGVVMSATLGRVREFLGYARYLGEFFDPERVHWRVLRPWRATYWKTLPEGHRAMYRYPTITYFDHHQRRYAESYHRFEELRGNRRWYEWT